MDSSIRKLYEDGLISARAAYDKAIDKSALEDIGEAASVAPPSD
jgi:hypothetical protein